MHLINLGLKTQRKHLLQAFIAGYRGFAGKAAAAAAAAGRKKAEKLPDWSKAVQLRNANLKPFTIRPEIEHLDIPVEEPKKRRPRVYPSRKSKVVRDFKEYIADELVPEPEKKKVASETIPQVKDFSPKVFANVFHSCKKGGFFHRDLFGELAKKANNVKYYVSSLTSLEMSMMVQSLGAISRHTAELREKRGSQSAKSVFPGFGKLVRDLIRECMYREKTEYRRSDPAGMGIIMYGFGLIFSHTRLDDEEFAARQVVNLGLKKLTKATKLPELKPHTIACALQGCAFLDIRNDELLDQVCAEIMRRFQSGVDGDQVAPEMGPIGPVAKDWPDKYNSVYTEGSGWDARERLETVFPSQTLATVIWSLGKLGHYHKEGFDAIEKEVVHRIGRFRAKDLYRILQGLIWVENASRDTIHVLCDELCKPNVLASLPEEFLSGLIPLLGEAQYQNGISMDAVGIEVSKSSRLSNFTDQHLSSIIEGLATAGYSKKLVLDELFDELSLRKKLTTHPAPELLSTVRAVHKLQYTDKRVLNELSVGLLNYNKLHNLDEENLMQVLTAYGSLGHRDEKLLNRLGAEMVLRGRLHRLDEQYLADMVLHFGKLGYKDRKVLKKLSAEIGSPMRLRQLTIEQMASIVKGFGNSSFFHERVASELLKRLQYSLSNFSDPRDFAGMIRSLAYVKNSMGPAFISSRLAPFLVNVCSECSYPETQHLFGLQSSMVTAWGLSQLRYIDPKLFDFLAERFVLSAKKGISFQSDHVLVFLESLARANHHNSTFEEFLEKWLNDRMHGLNSKQVVRTLWSINVLDWSKPSVEEGLCSQLISLDTWTGIDWIKIIQALHNSKPSHEGQTATNRNIILSMAMSQLDGVFSSNEREKEHGGGLDQRVNEALSSLGVEYEKNVVIEKPWLVASTAVESLKLVVEIGGNHDYGLRGGDLLGHACFRDRLFLRSGYKVLRLIPAEVMGADGISIVDRLRSELVEQHGEEINILRASRKLSYNE